MSIVVWGNGSESVDDLLNKIPGSLEVDLVEKLDEVFDVVMEYDQCSLFLDYDVEPKKIDKLIKQIRKKHQDVHIYLFCNSLNQEKIISHQKSKTGAEGYLRSPLDVTFLYALLGKVLEENVPELPPEAIISNKTNVSSRQEPFQSISSVSPLDVANSSDDDGLDLGADDEQVLNLNDELMHAKESMTTSDKAVFEDVVDEIELNRDFIHHQNEYSSKIQNIFNTLFIDTSLGESTMADKNLDDDLLLDENLSLDADLGDTDLESSGDLDLGGAGDLDLNLEGDSELELGGNDDLAIDATQDTSDSGLDMDLSGTDDLELGGGDDVSIGEDDDSGLDLGSDDSGLDLGSDDSGLDLGSDDSGLELGSDDSGLDLGSDDSGLDLGSDDSGLDLGSDDSGLELGSDDSGLDLGSDDSGLDLGSDDVTLGDMSDDLDTTSATEELDLTAGGDLDAIEGDELDFSSEEEINIEAEDEIDETGRDNRPITGADEDHLDNVMAEIEAMMADETMTEATMDLTDDLQTPEDLDAMLVEDDHIAEDLGFDAPVIEEDLSFEQNDDQVVEDDLDYSNAPSDDDLEDLSANPEEMDATQMFDPTMDEIMASTIEEEDVAPMQFQEAPFKRPGQDKTSTHVRNARAEIDEMMADNDQDRSFGTSNDPTDIEIKAPDKNYSSSEVISQAEMVGFHNEELAKLAATIKNLREERIQLISKIEELEHKKEMEKREGIAVKAELDEKKIELSLIKKRFNKHLEEAEYRAQLAEEKQRIIEERNKSMKQELDKANQKIRFDIKKIQARENELENQLELLRADSEVQIKNRDQRILELKRKIDSLEFDLESIAEQEKQSKEENVEVEEKMEMVMKTLRSAITILEGDEKQFQSFEFLKKKNMDI